MIKKPIKLSYGGKVAKETKVVQSIREMFHLDPIIKYIKDTLCIKLDRKTIFQR